MSTAKVLVRIPSDLVAELVAEGLAEAAAPRRSGGWEIAATWFTTTGTVISLMQGPETVTWLARALLARRKPKQGKVAYLDAKGPGGELRIPVTELTSLEDVERLLLATVFPPKKK
jgi:hypothetical protein